MQCAACNANVNKIWAPTVRSVIVINMNAMNASPNTTKQMSAETQHTMRSLVITKHIYLSLNLCHILNQTLRLRWYFSTQIILNSNYYRFHCVLVVFSNELCFTCNFSANDVKMKTTKQLIHKWMYFRKLMFS